MMTKPLSAVVRAAAVAAVTAALILPLALPRAAQAWWVRPGFGVVVGVPGPIVVPPPFYAPPPVAYPPPVYYRPYGPVCVPAHWVNGYFVPGHWR